MFGDLLFGELFFGGSAASPGDTDTPIVNAIIHDATGRITYIHRSEVRVVNEIAYVEVLSPVRSWVKT